MFRASSETNRTENTKKMFTLFVITILVSCVTALPLEDRSNINVNLDSTDLVKRSTQGEPKMTSAMVRSPQMSLIN